MVAGGARLGRACAVRRAFRPGNGAAVAVPPTASVLPRIETVSVNRGVMERLDAAFAR